MTQNKSDKIKPLVEILIAVTLFILFTYLLQKNLEEINLLIGDSWLGMLLYVLVVIIAIIIAPISAMPLLPIASNLWGWFFAAVLSIVGWTIGAFIAFIIARRYGLPLVKRFISIEKINRLENVIPKQNVFWSIVFFRMVIPVDILSYALGLFSQISSWRYFLATIIGVSPFAFVFAYLGGMPFLYQIIALLIALFIFFIGLLPGIKNKKKEKVVIRVYFWGGKKLGIKIKSSCDECDISIPIIKNLLKKEFKSQPVKIEIKPWLDNIFEVFFRYKAWHAPIIAVNNRLISQGKLVDVKVLQKVIKEELKK